MKLFFALCFLVLVGCTSGSRKSDESFLDLDFLKKSQKENIDVDELQHNLNFRRERTNLGFAQKRFNTCEAGAGYSETSNCRTRYFGVLNFKIWCRNSTGTVESVTRSELEPLDSDNVKLIFGGVKGYSSIENGYGQVRGISKHSFTNKYLIVKIDSHALRLKVADADRIIVPGDWCD